MTTSVDVAVPVSGHQSSYWWGPLMERYAAWREHIPGRLITTGAAMPDHTKNMAIEAMQVGKNAGLTSYNRNELVKRFTSEWILFIDHDTLPPADALPRLLALQKPIVGGVYYSRNSPHYPLLYRRQPNGLYKTITDFERGALVEVDATGMGCTLIHRDVFVDIMQNYTRLQRANGSTFLVHNDDLDTRALPSRFRTDQPTVYGDERGLMYVEPVRVLPPHLEEQFDFPFFTMEHGRTEDFDFCEKAKRVGYRIYVDTSVECDHWQQIAIEGQHFRHLRTEAKIGGALPPHMSAGGVG